MWHSWIPKNIVKKVSNFDSSDHRTVFHFPSVHFKLALAWRRWCCFWIMSSNGVSFNLHWWMPQQSMVSDCDSQWSFEDIRYCRYRQIDIQSLKLFWNCVTIWGHILQLYFRRLRDWIINLLHVTMRATEAWYLLQPVFHHKTDISFIFALVSLPDHHFWATMAKANVVQGESSFRWSLYLIMSLIGCQFT